MVEADAVRGARHGYLSAQMLPSYPIDSSIKLLAGKTLVTDSIQLDRLEWNWTGVEIRLGRMASSAEAGPSGRSRRTPKSFACLISSDSAGIVVSGASRTSGSGIVESGFSRTSRRGLQFDDVPFRIGRPRA